MSGVKRYFKEEFDLRTLVLQHPRPSEFYLSAWQRTRSVVPLLIWRMVLFLASVGIVLASMIIYIIDHIYGYWFIYLTHWGLLSILLATGFALLISVRCYIYGPISAEFVLPWYVKTYWVLQNIAVPISFLITIFYWTVLYGAGIDEEHNHGLDVAVHGLNSLLMFLLLMSTSHPARILHIYQPICFSLCYLAFGLVYYWAGGVNTENERWVYPVINWANPGSTIGVCAITGLLLVLLHLLTVGLATGRDAVARKLIETSDVRTVDEVYPLRRPVNDA